MLCVHWSGTMQANGSSAGRDAPAEMSVGSLIGYKSLSAIVLRAAFARCTLEVSGERNVRQLIGLVPALGLALALGACVTNAPPTQKLSAGEWRIEGRTDRVADKPSFTAVNVTRSRNAGVNPLELQLATLQLLCFDNAPVVRLHFSHSVGSNRNSRLSYRFDQNPGRDVEARILRDYKTIVIEDRDDVISFINEMRTASSLIVQVHSLATSMSSADFKVGGAPAAIDAAYAGCPLPEKQRSASS